MASFRVTPPPPLVHIARVTSAILVLTAAAHAAPAIGENVPVPGGLAALARALDVESLDPAQCVTQVARLVYSTPALADARDGLPRRLVTHLNTVRATATPASGVDVVPVPLTAAVWSRAIFKRTVSAESLFAAILSDTNAALLAHGLAALDDETLAYFAGRPALLTALYTRHAPTFATFSAHLRIHDGRVVPPGGHTAIPLWESVLNQRVADPEDFVLALHRNNNGRLAYLYDVIGSVDTAHATFALGLWLPEQSTRLERFRALAMTVTSAFAEWRPTKIPFVRPAYDLIALLQRVRLDGSGRPMFPASQRMWMAVLSRTDYHGSAASGPDGPIDAAALAALTLKGFTGARNELLDQFAFGQRVFASANTASSSDVAAAIAAFRRFPMLMLTLDLAGIRRPQTYIAFAGRAVELSALRAREKQVALTQFQGAIALVARMTRAQAIDQTTAERLLSALAGVRITEKEGYAGAMASWLDRDLRAVLGGTAHFEEALIQALAGGTQAPGARTVTWEGQSYVWDLRASEAARIRRFLARRNAASLDRLLEQQRAWTPGAPGAQRGAEAFDAQLAGALVNMVYAIAWSDPQGAARLDRSLPDRHDLGVGAPTASLRIRTPWAMPRLVFRPAQPWHVEGALLGLEIALAPLRLRAINSSPPRESRVFSTVRASFIGSLGLMNLFALKDGDARAIADAVARGQQRIDAVRSTHDAAGLAGEVRMDGWRARALQWSVVHAPGEVPAHFTMSDRLTLGGGSELLLDAWGMSAVEAFACLCTYLRLPGFSAAVVGRPEVGVLATTVPDLNLRVAALLHDLALPAALAPAILDSALHDLLNDATPVHADDWMSVVRRAGILSRERVEDYVAAVTAAAGPLASHPSAGRLP